MEIHRSRPRKPGASERLAGERVEVLDKACALDQRQAVATYAPGQLGEPIVPQPVDQHPIHDQPHWAAPITLRLELWPPGLEARHAIGNPSEPSLQPLH